MLEEYQITNKIEQEIKTKEIEVSKYIFMYVRTYGRSCILLGDMYVDVLVLVILMKTIIKF